MQRSKELPDGDTEVEAMIQKWSELLRGNEVKGNNSQRVLDALEAPILEVSGGGYVTDILSACETNIFIAFSLSYVLQVL